MKFEEMIEIAKSIKCKDDEITSNLPELNKSRYFTLLKPFGDVTAVAVEAKNNKASDGSRFYKINGDVYYSIIGYKGGSGWGIGKFDKVQTIQFLKQHGAKISNKEAATNWQYNRASRFKNRGFDSKINDTIKYVFKKGDSISFMNSCDYGMNIPLIEGAKKYTFNKDVTFYTKNDIQNYVESELTNKYNAHKRSGWMVDWDELKKFTVKDSKVKDFMGSAAGGFVWWPDEKDFEKDVIVYRDNNGDGKVHKVVVPGASKDAKKVYEYFEKLTAQRKRNLDSRSVNDVKYKFGFDVYKLDSNGDELDILKSFKDKNQAKRYVDELAKQGISSHVCYDISPDPDDYGDSDYEVGEYGQGEVIYEKIVKNKSKDSKAKDGSFLEEMRKEDEARIAKWGKREAAIWKNTDWKARNYKPMLINNDSFTKDVKVNGLKGTYKILKNVKFVLEISPNTIYEPKYVPLEQYTKYKDYAWVYDGNKKNGYIVIDRADTYELYDLLTK